MTKVNETFFYVTAWNSKCISAFQYNGNNCSASFFADISQAMTVTDSHLVAPYHLHNDHHLHNINIDGRRFFNCMLFY